MLLMVLKQWQGDTFSVYQWRREEVKAKGCEGKTILFKIFFLTKKLVSGFHEEFLIFLDIESLYTLFQVNKGMQNHRKNFRKG